MKEYSYGVIPFFKDEETGKHKVFLIHQYGSVGDLLWTFPKGGPEIGETPTETATRELTEETAIKMFRLIETKSYSISYSFMHDGEIVEKTATYFIGFAQSKDFTIQEKEVKEAGWFSPEAARERLTFPDYKKLLDEALADLDKLT